MDSYAWVELFLGSEKGKKSRRLILEAEQVRTPGVVLAEISRKYHREKMDLKTVRSRLETISSTTIITGVDVKLALRAGATYVELLEKAKRERLRTPSLFDAIVLATAREYDSNLVTGDEHFGNLPETIFLR